DYVRHYELNRAEGLVLRYLTDAYKGMVQTVPEDAKTDDVYDLTEWLKETVRQTDSSLLDEWERLRYGVEVVEAAPLPATPTDVTANERAFRLMVRNEVFRQVELLARRSHPDAPDMAAYWAEH